MEMVRSQTQGLKNVRLATARARCVRLDRLFWDQSQLFQPAMTVTEVDKYLKRNAVSELMELLNADPEQESTDREFWVEGDEKLKDLLDFILSN